MRWDVSLIAAICLAAYASTAIAGPDEARQRNLFVMTGRILDESMEGSLNVGGARYENNYVTGIGMQWLGEPGRFLTLGYEVGTALRYGQGQSAETWGGAVAKFRDLGVAGGWKMTPTVVFGLSLVSAVRSGRETEQVEKHDGDARLLFYLSPEIAFSPRGRDWSLFWRLHHRSGGGQTLGDMKGATNANAIGFRKQF